MFLLQALASQENCVERRRFKSELKAMLYPVPAPSKMTNTSTSTSKTRFLQALMSVQPPPIGQYYAVSSLIQSFTAAPPSSGHNHPMLHESPFLAPPTKFTHCSKFKTYLEAARVLLSYSLNSLENFFDGIKGALDTAMSAHYSFAPCAE
jgi:hypothetical protein